MTRRFMRAIFGSIMAYLYTDHANLVKLQEIALSRLDPVAFRMNAELTQDGSELRNLAGRTMRLADGLSRSTVGKELSKEKFEAVVELLEDRTQDLVRKQ